MKWIEVKQNDLPYYIKWKKENDLPYYKEGENYFMSGWLLSLTMVVSEQCNDIQKCLELSDRPTKTRSTQGPNGRNKMTKKALFKTCTKMKITQCPSTNKCLQNVVISI